MTEEPARLLSHGFLTKTAAIFAELRLPPDERARLERERRDMLEEAYRSDAFRVWPYASLPRGLAQYSDQSDWDLAVLIPKPFRKSQLIVSWISRTFPSEPVDIRSLPDGAMILFGYDGDPPKSSPWHPLNMPAGSGYLGAPKALEGFRAVVESSGNGRVKGAKNPYTSRNGHMFSFLDANGAMALRLSKELEAEFRGRYGSGPVIQYGSTMRGYSLVPPELLEDTDALREWYDRAWEWIGTLDPKPTKK